MATQYDIVKAYADLYYESASVKKDIIVLGFQFGPVNIRFAFNLMKEVILKIQAVC